MTEPRPKLGPRIVLGLGMLADIAECQFQEWEANDGEGGHTPALGDAIQDGRRAIAWIDRLRAWWPDRKRREQ